MYEGAGWLTSRVDSSGGHTARVRAGVEEEPDWIEMPLAERVVAARDFERTTGESDLMFEFELGVLR